MIYSGPSFIASPLYYLDPPQWPSRTESIECSIENQAFSPSYDLSPPHKTIPYMEYWMIYKGPGFLAVVWWFGSSPKDHPVQRVLNDIRFSPLYDLDPPQRPSRTESIECSIEDQAFSPSYDLAPPQKTIPYREYWLIYRGPGFLAVVWFGYSPKDHPVQRVLNDTGFLTVVWFGSSSKTIPYREYWMFYRGPGFLAVVWFGSSPTDHPVQRVLNYI